jgi:pSer/pThr/pTyr-binding forkhead associated (FHA) protein
MVADCCKLVVAVLTAPGARYSPRMGQPLARFEVVAGRAIGMSILLDDELLIGRHADGAGRLADDDEISRSHARISLDRSGFCAIEDLGSTNGTFVNGLRIAGPQTLSVGDTIEVGGTTLVVRELPIPTSERTLKAVHPQPTVAPRGSVSASQETPSIARGPSGRPQRGLHSADRPSADRPMPAPGSAPADADADAEPATAHANLSLTLHVDFAAREAAVAIGEGAEPIRLTFDGEAWRPASS